MYEIITDKNIHSGTMVNAHKPINSIAKYGHNNIKIIVNIIFIIFIIFLYLLSLSLFINVKIVVNIPNIYIIEDIIYV